MYQELTGRLEEEFGCSTDATHYLLRWRPRIDTGLAVEREHGRVRSHAQVWVPHPEGRRPIPANAVEYPAGRGRHSNTYCLPGLGRRRPALRIKITTPADVDALVVFLRDLPPIREAA